MPDLSHREQGIRKANVIRSQHLKDGERVNEMPVITRIRTDDQKKGYYEIDVAQASGNTRTLSVHEDILVRHELRKGLKLEESELGHIVSEAKNTDAWLDALRYLSIRMRSCYEITCYLKKRGHGSEQTEAVIRRLKNERLIDDQEFAAAFVRSRIRLSTKGPKMIYRELLQAGIDPKTASAAAKLYPRDVQLDHARTYLQKKLTSVKNKKSFSEATQVLSRLLMQRGYSREVTVQAISEIGEFLEGSSAAALNYQGEKALRKYKKCSGDELFYKVKSFLYRKGFAVDEITAFLHENTGK